MVFSAEAQLVGDCLEIGTCFEREPWGISQEFHMAISEGFDRDFMAEFLNLSYS
jgi:hypothetical protein